ncbi:hypothetical protein [Myroides pelagicus]|uniref:Uncharacterized protein n=1 Tax=Myroides pelagicus TaxID=270914 RepID=A0A7K1GQC3_9FLAO|nr:hypothetical protein [Myroides pelagicus]MTH31056.1 hypothetical protein [Myroides pelagicus]
MNNRTSKNLFESPRDLNTPELPLEVQKELSDLTIITAKRLEEELGRPATFEDYIADHIKQTSFKQAEEYFNGRKYAWNLIGRDTSNAEAVYDKFFKRKGQVLDISNVYSMIDGVAENNKIIESAIASQYTNSEIYNTESKSIIKESLLSDNITNNPHPKTSSSKCVKCNSDKELSEELCSNCKSDKNLDDFLFGAVFIWILGASGIFALIRYLVNPEISTEVILVVLFIGFIVVNRYLRSRKKKN